MKMKLSVLLMLIAAVLMSLAGCGKAESTDKPDTQITADSQSTSDIMSDADFSDMFDPETFDHAYTLQIRDLDQAILTVTYNDGSDSEEVDSYTWFGSGGMTIGQMMDEWSVESIVPSCEGYDFLGWMVYETVTTTDENGFDEYTENVLFDGRIFTTEEMMALELTDADICFYTVWDLVCSECGEHKLCSAYYVDDGCYFVCDDCLSVFEAGL